MSDSDLDLVETERIVDALKRRSDAVLVAMSQDRTRSVEDNHIHYRGGFARMNGLALIVVADLIANRIEKRLM